MLAQLTVQDLALFHRLSLEFQPGFTVLTGETGAGKSLLIDAISLALGGRPGAMVVRAGAERALVEAAFEVGPGQLADWAEEGLVVLTREITASGRSTCRVNGRICAAATAREIGTRLLDLHGQHDHQSLASPMRHVELLDEWAAPELGAIRESAAGLYRQVRDLSRALLDRQAHQREAKEREELHRFQLAEIDAAGITPGEEEALEADRLRLANAERLNTATGQALQRLLGAEPCGLDMLAAAAGHLAAGAAVDPRLEPVLEALQGAELSAREAARELERYHENIEFNPARLEQVTERLELLRRLKRKYAESLEQVLARRDELAGLLENLAGEDRRAEALAGEQAATITGLRTEVERLARARKEAAGRFDRAVAAVLGELAMPQLRFQTCVTPGAPDRWEEGPAVALGQAEFLIGPNPGEPFQPLARIASGGELSRLMLAIKSVLSAAEAARTLIFDEIDVGVGGRTGGVIGRRMAGLSETNQVLCVTHLPQIAAMAGQHLYVSKTARGDRTEIGVQRLEGRSRIAELARMLGGAEVTAVPHAERLLAEAGAATVAPGRR